MLDNYGSPSADAQPNYGSSNDLPTYSDNSLPTYSDNSLPTYADNSLSTYSPSSNVPSYSG